MIPKFMEGLFVDPFNFLNKNIINPVLGDRITTSPECEIKFNQEGNSNIITATCTTTIGDGDIRGFYLPWQPLAGKYMVLEQNEPTTFFTTAIMDGCSFGLRLSDDKQALKVIHANISYESFPSIEEREQTFKNGYSWIHPTDYERMEGDIFSPESYNEKKEPRLYHPNHCGIIIGVKRGIADPWIFVLQTIDIYGEYYRLIKTTLLNY